MRKAVSIFFLSLCVFTFSEFHQLMKLPVLFQHFAEHRQEDPTITIFAFLKLHYKGSFAIDDDYKRDQELPFRTNETLVNNITACEFNFPLYVVVPHSPVNEKEYSILKENKIPVICIQDIFQPPRIAFS